MLRYYILGLIDMVGIDVEIFRIVWVFVNVRIVLLNILYVCIVVYVFVCSLINKKMLLVLVELLCLYKISYFLSICIMSLKNMIIINRF